MKKAKSLILALILAVSALGGAASAIIAPPSDVEGKWYAEYADTCVINGWMDVSDGNKFCPEGLVTRGEFIKALYFSSHYSGVSEDDILDFINYNVSEDDGSYNGFSDVAADDEALANAVKWAVENGIVKGTGNGKFSPEGILTREMAAAMLYRFMGAKLAPTKESKTFTDGDRISSWAKEAVKWANAVGLLGGYKDGSVKPRKNLTRAECAKLVCVACETVASLQPAPTEPEPQPEPAPAPTPDPVPPTQPMTERELLMDFCAKTAKLNLTSASSGVISPVSLLYALGMAENGAGGETLAQLEKAIGMPVGSLNRLMKDYTEELKSAGAKINAANSVWINEDLGVEFKPEYLEKLSEYYAAEGFGGAFNDELCAKLNEWVSDETYGMIDKLLENMNPDAAMYLVNALALDLEWATKYEQDNDGKFTREDGTEEDCKMLCGTESVYLQDYNTKGFMKRYEDGSKFVALLPQKGLAMEDYLESLTGDKLQRLIDTRRTGCEVLTGMPEFEDESSFSLIDSLKAMGITDMFGSADFSGMSDTPLNVSDVIQKSFIQVTKDGTKAAAATVIEIEIGAAEPPEEVYSVYLDRPFVYMILDPYESLPLFIGVVNSTQG